MSLQAEVGEWHRSYFGPAPINDRLYKKFREESQEWLDGPTAEESADVLIVLCAWADRNGFDLEAVAREKLAKVRGRDQLSRDALRGII